MSEDGGRIKMMPITDALIGDVVKFHVQTQYIETGKEVTLTLFDDDKVLNTQEDKVDDEIGLVYSVNGKPDELFFQS